MGLIKGSQWFSHPFSPTESNYTLWNPVNNGIFTISTHAGFLSSTVYVPGTQLTSFLGCWHLPFSGKIFQNMGHLCICKWSLPLINVYSKYVKFYNLKNIFPHLAVLSLNSIPAPCKKKNMHEFAAFHFHYFRSFLPHPPPLLAMLLPLEKHPSLHPWRRKLGV